MITIESKSLKDLSEKLVLLEVLGCKEAVALKVSGNPSLRTFRDFLLKGGGLEKHVFDVDGVSFDGRVLPYSTIADRDEDLHKRMPYIGFFYWKERDVFVFVTEMPTLTQLDIKWEAAPRALQFVEYLEEREKEGVKHDS